MVFDDQTILENQEEDATCFKCDENLENSSSYLEHKICSKCNFHFHISARDRIKSLVDRGTFNEIFNKIKELLRKEDQISPNGLASVSSS